MSRFAPALAVALLVAVALAHAVQAGTSLAEELSELGEISSKIVELKQNFKQDLRNRGKNKHRKGKKNSGHRRKKARQQRIKSAKQKKKSPRGKKKMRQRNKSVRRGKTSGKRRNKFGRRRNKSAKPRRKAGQKRRGKMATGNSRQTCDEQALCQKIKDFIKISNQLRKVKRIIKVCSLMENKAKKSATEFSATINSLTSALTASRMAGGPPRRKFASRQNMTKLDDVTSIRDKLNNCTATVQSKCDTTTVEGCQNTTLLTQCEKELNAWTTKFGPAKGSCLQASKDCCNCINAIPDVPSQCLSFDKLTDAAVKKKSTCTSGNSEGSFGFCRKLQQEAAIKGPTVAKLHCETATTTSAPLITTLPLTTTTTTMFLTTTTTSVDLTLNVSSLEASIVTLLDTVGSLTTKVEDITKKVDANTAKGDANAAAIALKCDKSTCTTIQAEQTKLESCLGDVTSSDCPAVLPGKTGVATVSANAAALANKCDATKCTAVETKVTDVESCLSDTTSAKCPAATSGKKSVPGAIAELETPTVFSCYYSTPSIMSTVLKLGGYTACDVNVGTAMDKTTGVFTAKKAGKYRFTFMTLVLPENKKKALAFLMQKEVGGGDQYIARALAQSKIDVQQEQITITLDVILDVAVGTEIYIGISIYNIPGTSGGSLPEQPNAPWQTYFTGEYISA